MVRIMMTAIATTATTDTLAATTKLGALGVDVGVTRLVDVGTVALVEG